MRIGIVAMVLLLAAAGLAFSVSGIPGPVCEGNSSCMINGTCNESCTCIDPGNCTENCTCLNNSSCVQNCSGSGPCPVKDNSEESGCGAAGKGCPFRI